MRMYVILLVPGIQPAVNNGSCYQFFLSRPPPPSPSLPTHTQQCLTNVAAFPMLTMKTLPASKHIVLKSQHSSSQSQGRFNSKETDGLPLQIIKGKSRGQVLRGQEHSVQFLRGHVGPFTQQKCQNNHNLVLKQLLWAKWSTQSKLLFSFSQL